MLNVKLLRKVRNRIATIPESYDQSRWVQSNDKAPRGTMACLAGEAIICSQPSVGEGIKTLRRATARHDNTFRYWVGYAQKGCAVTWSFAKRC